MKDLGSYEVAQKVDSLKLVVDGILNPDKIDIERCLEFVNNDKF
jgi:hypothetical protein